MSESLADWLSLREAADAAARSMALTRAIADVLARRTPLRVLDLGTGTGSNIRYLAPRLPVPQEWLAVDRDAALLSRIMPPVPRCRIDTRQANLGTLDGDLFADRDLVTASALLDLVSAAWLDSLARHCRDVKAAALFALTYNGNSRCDPPEPEDAMVRDLMNRHQRQNDKGFGRAAGPEAPEAAASAFTSVGYTVRRARAAAATDRRLGGRRDRNRAEQSRSDPRLAVAPARARRRRHLPHRRGP
jgi:trans-aconitate methyltransferase